MIRRPPRSTLFPYTTPSDLDGHIKHVAGQCDFGAGDDGGVVAQNNCADLVFQQVEHEDRKSTRLNSSHGYISYAVFCLKKKNKHIRLTVHLVRSAAIADHEY